MAGYGLAVEIDHGYGITTLYGHASRVIVQKGQEVTRGDIIARVGSTGISTASHLHYEVRVDGKAQDPTTYILPETIRVAVNSKTMRPYYVVSWGAFDGANTLPMVYMATIEDSSEKIVEMLVTEDGKGKPVAA